MRKRAQIKSKHTHIEPKHVSLQKTPKREEKSRSSVKNWWVALILLGVFFLVLFHNTYFNASSEIAIDENSEGYARYLLSGPDPYYNMRMIQETSETGAYQFYSEHDPMINYPVGKSGNRAPLLNMFALGFSNFFKPFMEEVDAIGYSMQFTPALYGALLIIPIYFLGKTLFNKKAGLIAALFVALIPIHVGSGHGSAYSLFDHDSFIHLIFVLTFLFMVLSMREKDKTKSVLYAVLAGIAIAGLSMVWVEARFLYVIIGGYAIVQYIVDIFTNKIESKGLITPGIALLTGYMVSLPVTASRAAGFSFDVSFFMVVGVIGFGVLYYLFGRKKIPWTLSLPAIFIASSSALALLYFISRSTARIPVISGLSPLANIIFGTGVYGNKVSMTIAEAGTYAISQNVMSFGPALYWLAWAGFLFLLWRYYKDKLRRDYFFIIVLFIVFLYLTSTAGRFLNEIVPLIAILAGWITWFVVDKIDYKQMIRNIRSAGGGIHGIRRGIKIIHVFGILFLAFIVIAPNAYVALDAAVPAKYYEKEDGRDTTLKWEMFGEEHQGAFGLSLYKERYWTDAFNWLNQQDTDIENPVERPAFISWWDYGFYAVALGGHPTVADNFQSGIPPAGNFHTATSEEEAVAVLIIRILEGNKKDNNGKVSEDVKQVLIDYLGEDNGQDLISWVEDPTSSPSYQSPINEQFNEYITRGEIDERLLVVGAQWVENAVYHDFVDMINHGDFADNKTGLTSEEITWLYLHLQDATGYSIRYYGVEGYDKQIFNIFGFLSDKSLVMLGAPEDDFVEILYSGTEYTPAGAVKRQITNEPLKDYLDMPDSEKRYIVVESTSTRYKDAYFDTMFYKTYIGPYDIDPNTGAKKEFRWQLPCYQMKHFYAEFISDGTEYPSQYATGKAAVVIAKYYAGARLNGSIWLNNSKIDATVAVMKNLTYYEGAEQPIEHDSFKYVASSGEGATDEFSVIAGADVYLQISKNLGEMIFTIKNVTFDGPPGTEYAPITDDDAMRRPGSNYERYLNITILPAKLSGVVYNDKDGDGVYNSSIDEPLENVAVELFEIKRIQDGQIDQQGEKITVQTDENGSYSVSGLVPGIYRITTYDEDGYIIHMSELFLYEGEKTYNIINPELGDIEGIVYYDENLDGKYTPGEEKNSAEVTLSYITDIQTGATMEVDTVITDDEGFYRFEDLVPREYNNYIVSVDDFEGYQYYDFVTIPEGETKTYNISLELAAVTLKGQTRYDEAGIEEVKIDFIKNESVARNTAKDATTLTDGSGNYSIDLQPGVYDVLITKWEDEATLVYILEGEQVTLVKGQEETTMNFDLIKKSVTVSGFTSYEGTNIENVTIRFMPDFETENNTGVYTMAVSNASGFYELEVAPGVYDVYAESEEFFDNGEAYIYLWEGSLSLYESDIKVGKTFDIDQLDI